MATQLASACKDDSFLSGSSTLPGLFRLPREVRDVIYSYTLYQPGGLYYYRDQDYKCTFSASNEAFEFNQLKYTCKQLRDETLGLELELENELIFLFWPGREGKYMEMLPGNQFLGFLDMCHETWRCHIRRVYLRDLRDSDQLIGSYENSSSGILDLHLIVRICHHYPNFFVLWEHPLPTFLGGGQDCPASLIGDGLMFSIGFRNNKANRKQVWETIDLLGIEVALGTATIYQTYWRKDVPKSCNLHSAQYKESSVEAPNFRLLPRDGPFDETRFRENIEKWSKEYTPRQKLDTQDRKDAWVQLAKEWYANGI